VETGQFTQPEPGKPNRYPHFGRRDVPAGNIEGRQAFSPVGKDQASGMGAAAEARSEGGHGVRRGGPVFLLPGDRHAEKRNHGMAASLETGIRHGRRS